MQLSPHTGRVTSGISAATCALLGTVATSSHATEVETSTLFYSEPNRVTAIETVIQGTRASQDGRSLALKLTFDALTGASANGATPANRLQTFTRPSGQSSYTAKPRETPLDPSFQDVRLAAAVNIGRPLGRLSQATYGINISAEQDYLSFGLSGGITRDFALKNTTLAGGFAFSRDSVKPRAGTPIPFGRMSAIVPGDGEDGGRATRGAGEGEEEGEEGPGKAKTLGDLMVGLTQLMSRGTIARVNYSLGWSSGYLTDPYKILSEIQPTSGAEPGDPTDYLFERRPDRRRRQSLFGEARQRLGGDVAQVSYRHYWDDWSIESSTVDARFMRKLGKRASISPHFRWYEQSAADFYRRYLVQGEPLPNHASADYRLGSFNATTMGLEGTRELAAGPTLRAALEYYAQRGDDHPAKAFGALVGHDLFPSVTSWMVRVGASMPVKW